MFCDNLKVSLAAAVSCMLRLKIIVTRPGPLIRVGSSGCPIQVLALVIAFTAFVLKADEPLSLAGNWRCQLDHEDAGLGQRWFELELRERVKLPATLAAQGIGDDISTNTPWIGGIVDKSWFTAPEYAPYRQPGNVKVPYWLQPEKYYAGAAWYQRDFEVPRAWKGRRLVLFLERPHWETRVWVNRQLVGTNQSLATPHEYDLGQLPPGRHTLVVRVDNRMVIDIGENSHGISDHTQGNWNGIVGRIELRSTPLVWLEDVQIYPNARSRMVRVKARIGNARGAAGRGVLEVAGVKQPVAWSESGGEATMEVAWNPKAECWDEFKPNLHTLSVNLIPEGESPTTRKVQFGFRDFAVAGTQFTINDRKTYLRGTLECAIFPKTGHPPTDVEAWRNVLRAARAHGLNHLRFHSWCPPEAAFVAADEAGFYLQVETCWPNQSTAIGNGLSVDRWVYDETDRILKAYGNHPSFVLMAHGNEPGGNKANAYLAEYVKHYRARDARRLWTSGSGWPQLSDNEFHVTPDPRIQQWGAGLRSRINAKPPETLTDYRDYIAGRSVPVISHEIGQWCVYPNFDEISKYTGYLKARNFELFRNSLRSKGMIGQAREFLLASGKLQTLCYKEEIESALRTPGMGGFQLLDLHDFPGQGTALVGVLDPFWESKGYVTPAEYRRFCNATVPLARLPKRVFTTDESLEAVLEVSHFGPEPLTNAVTTWKLVDGRDKSVARGELPLASIAVNNGIALGNVNVDLNGIAAPARYKLVVNLAGRFENDWDIWVYPAEVDTAIPVGITVAHEFDETAQAALEAGGKVLLLVPPMRANGNERNQVALGFSSIFWNTAWTGRQPPNTLGILCDPNHALFADFPAESHSNWQWWYLISRAGALILDDLPLKMQPLVQVIDDWVTNRRLGLVVEARVGRGKLMVCSIDLESECEGNPVVQQFRASLCRYMSSSAFKPSVTLAPVQVQGLFGKLTALQKLGGKVVFTDSAHFAHMGERAIDANPASIWHTEWEGHAPGFPHELQIELGHAALWRGFSVLARQDGNRNGRIKEYEFYVSNDGRNWGEPVTRGSFANTADLQTTIFAQPVPARFVRLRALSGHGAEPFVALAELDILAIER